jgi:hypothetical protein
MSPAGRPKLPRESKAISHTFRLYEEEASQLGALAKAFGGKSEAIRVAISDLYNCVFGKGEP